MMSRLRKWHKCRKEKRRARRRKLAAYLRGVPHLFAKSIIIYCVICATLASAFSLLAQAHGATMEPVLALVLGFFGGELLLLCLKTILKKDTEEEPDENSVDKQDL